ncbi:unnamed protein product [Paramecium octaurelia]|uniref:Uncharacterized protein n=1 Tax=Paramecium octaurelia TaxID=43137 RepID=A0A8S1V665_PAROT|nr:unnamed protein product [Paramecium octaurelia]
MNKMAIFSYFEHYLINNFTKAFEQLIQKRIAQDIVREDQIYQIVSEESRQRVILIKTKLKQYQNL